MSPNETARPDDGYADAHDGQTILLGRLHKIYGVAGAPTEGIALKGRYGFIND
jgi:pilus assembly protein CpaC